MAVDAYCPHLGANMAAGGVVKGDCIECPFHGWQFEGHDGTCSSIPYAKKGLFIRTVVLLIFKVFVRTLLAVFSISVLITFYIA